MPAVKIMTPYPAPGITVERFGKQDMVIPYMIDKAGPFQLRVPMEDYTAAKGEAAVRQQAGQQAALIDKTFSI